MESTTLSAAPQSFTGPQPSRPAETSHSILYRRTQRGFMLLFCAAAAAVAAFLAFSGVHRNVPIGIGFVVAAITPIPYRKLTITIGNGFLEWRFGRMGMRRQVPLSEIVSATPARTRWYDGWGVHRTSRGWLYNVSGRDAVQVTLKSGERFLLGTDRPEQVAALLELR